MTNPGSQQPSSQQSATQWAVARVRNDVLGGRGTSSESERDRATRDRPTLGPLPTPLERELVHLNAMRRRQGLMLAGDENINKINRLRDIWGSSIPDVSGAGGGRGSRNTKSRFGRYVLVSELTALAVACLIEKLQSRARRRPRSP